MESEKESGETLKILLVSDIHLAYDYVEKMLNF